MEYPERANAAEWCADFFTNPISPKGPVVASAHFCIDSDSVVQCVREEDVAYHAGPVNEYSIGLEHAGYARQSDAEWRDAFSAAMLERSAKLAASLCLKYGIPVRRLTGQDLQNGERRGLCGHVDVTLGLQGGKGHVDPGPWFPWEWYLERVQDHLKALERGEDRPLREPSILAPEIARANVHTLDTTLFVPLEHAGQKYLVCPVYIAPVSIGEAKSLAESFGCELPTPALVDAIWRAADLKIDAGAMIRQHDGTPATMDSAEVHADQCKRLEQMVGERSLGLDFRLLAGAFKDVVLVNGKAGLYGWHRLDGTVIQPPYTGHAMAWKDFSQGLRLVKRASS